MHASRLPYHRPRISSTILGMLILLLFAPAGAAEDDYAILEKEMQEHVFTPCLSEAIQSREFKKTISMAGWDTANLTDEELLLLFKDHLANENVFEEMKAAILEQVIEKPEKVRNIWYKVTKAQCVKAMNEGFRKSTQRRFRRFGSGSLFDDYR